MTLLNRNRSKTPISVRRCDDLITHAPDTYAMPGMPFQIVKPQKNMLKRLQIDIKSCPSSVQGVASGVAASVRSIWRLPSTSNTLPPEDDSQPRFRKHMSLLALPARLLREQRKCLVPQMHQEVANSLLRSA